MTDHQPPTVAVPREPTEAMLDVVKPWPFHWPDAADATAEQRAAFTVDRLAARSTYIAMIEAAPAQPPAALDEAVGLLREIFQPADLVTYAGEPDDVQRSQWVSNGARRRIAAFLANLEPSQ